MYRKSITDFDQAQVNDLQHKLNELEAETKGMKMLEYYEDQIYFHQTEKRLKINEKVRIAL